ncbi:integral membrane protein-like protein [Eremomyces bilateralis CBS 781.70]|uniref:Integral membrane protein-like protein n=1 Tax=Eremomyces bilateralis CBS 781.70 TaxID=1392243 RepID=A0A6G1GDT9_9PEZI|nr:integral membrane protein-like protein [Eremomyces bilateralis CBS 781.70]KAF1816257.1 integral membrane protein-like protein [Eremomyces bilateralis CBS 781.70]
MASKSLIPFLVGMMLLTGVCNTLLTKYQDNQCVRNCDSPDPMERETFRQPVLQTAQMFVGEMGSCLIILCGQIYKSYQARKSSGYDPVPQSDATDDDVDTPAAPNGSESEGPPRKPLGAAHPERIPLSGYKVVYLALPACCDIAGTTLMNGGLLFVAASIYQMTRGALVLFVGLFSVIFLKRHLHLYKWFALFIVVTGVAVVGLAGVVEGRETLLPPGEEASTLGAVAYGAKAIVRGTVDEIREVELSVAVKTILGVLCIAFAQVFTATQFVVEERLMEKYSVDPLTAVGWEGIWGFSVTVIGMIILHAAYGSTAAGQYGYFDAQEGLKELFGNRAIGISSILIMISICGFNFFGLSLTRSVSATSRSIVDTCRTLFIWMVSLGLGWESFKWLQVLGFAMLVYGTFLFNDLVRPPLAACIPSEDGETEPLLPETPIEHN